MPMIFWAVFTSVVVWWGTMTRICLRWTLEGLSDGTVSKMSPLGMLAMCFLFWWVGIPCMWSAYCAKSGRSQIGHKALRSFAGESRWHRHERLEREHLERAKEVGMPPS